MNDSYGFVSENNSITISDGPFSHPKGKDSRPLFHSLQANISDVPFFISALSVSAPPSPFIPVPFLRPHGLKDRECTLLV